MPPASAETTLAERLRFQAGACQWLGSPLYGGLLERAADDVQTHGPVWDVLRGHEEDPGPSALALRLLGAVNRLVLRGDEPALAEIYAGHNPDPTAAWTAFAGTLERNTKELRRLVDLPVQTNEVGRSAALLCGFLAVAAETGLPLRLLEVGASAGLNLRWDRYRYLADGFAWGAKSSPLAIEFELAGDGVFPDPERVEVAARRGCDAAPLDPGSDEGRTTLLAYVWPDQSERIARVEAALAIAPECPVAIDRAGAAEWVERQLANPSPGQATVLYHSIVAQYLSEAERKEFHHHIQSAGERASAEAPLAWLRMEPAGDHADVRLTTWPGSVDRHLARAGYHGNPVELLSTSQPRAPSL